MKWTLIENQEMIFLRKTQYMMIPFPKLTGETNPNKVNRLKLSFNFGIPEHTAPITLEEFQRLSEVSPLNMPMLTGFNPPYSTVGSTQPQLSVFNEMAPDGFRLGVVGRLPVMYYDMSGKEGLYCLTFPQFTYTMVNGSSLVYEKIWRKLQNRILLKSLDMETFWEEE